MSLAVIHGSSSGIVLQFTRHLLRHTSLNVLATSRKQEQCLRSEISGNWGERLMCVQMDGTDESSICAASQRAASVYGQKSLRLMINVPGVLHVEKSLAEVSMANLLNTFSVNAFAHILACKYFVQLIPRKMDASLMINDPANGAIASDSCVIANISARVGSIADNKSGGWYSYRSSKAALNQLTVTLARELKARNLPAIAVALHPGTVKTRFSEEFVGHKTADGNGLFEPEDSVNRLMNVISGLKYDDCGSMGGFLDWKGSEIPW